MLALGALFSFMTYGVWSDHSNIVLKITTPFLAAMLILGLCTLPNIFAKRYYEVTVNTQLKKFIIRYPLLRSEKVVYFKDIKGYSNSTDKNYYGAWGPKNKHCITLYLFNGERIDLIQYQFSGFIRFKEFFQSLKFNYLGEEKFTIDLKGRRINYKY
jgi:hypothetical protein